MEAKKFFEQHLNKETALVTGILKSCGLTSFHPDYEDYEQEVRVHLCKVWEKVKGDIDEFNRTAYTYARCRLLDLFRTDTRTNCEQLSYDDNYDSAIYAEDNLDLHLFLSSLDVIELEICTHLLRGETVLETSKKMQLSRTTIYHYLKAMRERAKKVYHIE